MSAPGYVYAIECGDAVKIGFAKDPVRRADNLQIGSAPRHRLIGFIPGTKEDEIKIHEQCAAERIRGEWFRKTGCVSEFVAALPARAPKPRAPRKPDKRTAGREPTCVVTRLDPVRKRLSDDLKIVLPVFLAATMDLGHRDCAICIATHADGHRRRAPGSAPMRESYVTAMRFMSIHWPPGADWPRGIDRPDPIENRELREAIRFHRWRAKEQREAAARKFQVAAIDELCRLHEVWPA